MVDLATTLVNDYESQYSGKPKEQADAFMKELDDRKGDLADELFLEAVFGEKPFISRAEWEKNVLINVKWMFDSRELRKTVYDHILKSISPD
jgi:hypothetical protein